MENLNFRLLIKLRSKEMNIKINELAKNVGIRNATLYDYLSGKSEMGADKVETILNHLKIYRIN